MGELLLVAGALRNFQNLSAWYGSTDHDALPTDDLFYALALQPGLEQQITSAILAPDTMADTASHTLADLRKKIRATENSIRDRLEGLTCPPPALPSLWSRRPWWRPTPAFCSTAPRRPRKSSGS